MTAKYLLIVKVRAGIVVRDRPAPDSQGAAKMRTEPVGKALDADLIINIDGVPYARLIPQNPLRHEWVRVAERDRSIEYVEVIENGDVTTGQGGDVAAAINRLAAAVEQLAAK